MEEKEAVEGWIPAKKSRVDPRTGANPQQGPKKATHLVVGSRKKKSHTQTNKFSSLEVPREEEPNTEPSPLRQEDPPIISIAYPEPLARVVLEEEQDPPQEPNLARSGLGESEKEEGE